MLRALRTHDCTVSRYMYLSVNPASAYVPRQQARSFVTLFGPVQTFSSLNIQQRCSLLPSPSPSYTKPHIQSARSLRTAHIRKMASATSFYDFKPLDKRGQEVPLADYRGKVILIVNTASKCGFTPQYEGLEALYKKLKAEYPEDVVFLGFPCNQFGSQEPGTDDDIQNFCQINYGVSFPIMKKIDVNGSGADPLYEWLKTEKPGLMGLKRVKWNFEKFLIGRDGTVKGRWASTTKPESLEAPILEELKKPAPGAEKL